jgi:hypothetical protein
MCSLFRSGRVPASPRFFGSCADGRNKPGHDDGKARHRQRPICLWSDGDVKASTPEGASIFKSVLYRHFVRRTVNGVPMVFYADPIACKCVYSGTEAAFTAYKLAYSEDQAIYDQIDLHPP